MTVKYACLDVDYRDDHAIAGCVAFSSVSDSDPVGEYTAKLEQLLAYQPGQFYKRELPPLLNVLNQLPDQPELILVDGYVWLPNRRPGLGAHLYQALGKETRIIGVAKTRFRDARPAELLRGQSQNPLFITAAGIGVEEAVQFVADMHGPHRLPTLLKRVDRLCRDK